MKLIREADTLIGVLEQGDLKRDMSETISEVVAKLHALSEDDPKGKYKGSVTLKMDFTAQNGMVNITNDIKSKLPREDRRTDVFWTTEEGSLSTEHPSQRDMFGGPRVIEGRHQ